MSRHGGDIEAARRLAQAADGAADPYAFAMNTPEDLRRRLLESRLGGSSAETEAPAAAPAGGGDGGARRGAATESIAARAGELLDEVNFPEFVAGLIHGTFDAVVDSSIRQMEAFADLVSAVAKTSDDFTRENVSANQARDWLVEQHPGDLQIQFDGQRHRLTARTVDEFGEGGSPAWLSDYGLEGEHLSEELIESSLVPAARRRLGENRLHMLATMVLLGMNRVVVRDGTISAKVRFRAAAADKAAVEYAASQDPGGASSWGSRGAKQYTSHSTMISTVGTNVQTESNLRAELFGEVTVNFATETLPLDRFVDQAALALLTKNARQAGQGAAGAGSGAGPLPAPAGGGRPAPVVNGAVNGSGSAGGGAGGASAGQPGAVENGPADPGEAPA